MPKNTTQRIIDAKSRSTGLVFQTGGGGGGGVTDHGLLTGLADDDHTQYLNNTRGDLRYVPLARSVSGTGGLTGGGALSADLSLSLAASAAGDGLTLSAGVLAVGQGTGITVAADTVSLASTAAGAGLTHDSGVLAVGAGNGITVNADDVALAATAAGAGLTYTTGVLAVGVANTGAAGLTVEADTLRLTSSSDPGAAAAILASDGSGFLSLVKLRTPTIDTASGALTLQPATDVKLTPTSNLVKLTTGVALQSDNYASQTTGMRVNYAGEADFRYLFVDEMHAKSFVADLEQALAGGQIISKSVAVLGADFTAPAAGATATLTVRDLPSAANMAVFQANDYVRLRTFSRAAGSLTIADCWGVVTAYADQAGGLQTWTFTRSASTNAGTMAAGTVVATDAIVLDYGVTGNGFYEVNAIDGAYGANSPYAQVVTWATHPRTQTVRARFGKLDGLGFAGGTNEYGLYAGNGTADSSVYFRLSNAGVRLNNVPLRLYDSGTQTVNFDSAGTDIWIGPSSADKRLVWNGTTLTVVGTIAVQPGSSGMANLGDLDDMPDGTYFSRVNSTIISGGNIRVGSGTKDSTLDGWHIDSTEIVGQLDGADQVVFNTAGNIVAGGGKAGMTKNGFLIQTPADLPSYTWPFTHGGMHVVDTLPTTTWRSSLLFSEPVSVYTGARVRGWIAKYSGDLNGAEPGSGWFSTAEYAITVEDTAGHTWPVYHAGYTGNLAVKTAANVFTAAQEINKADPYLTLTNSSAASTANNATLQFMANTTVAERVSGRIVASFSDTTDATKTSRMYLQTYNNNSFLTVLAVVGNKVGIGDTTPSNQLDVAGAIGATTNISAGGYVQGTDFRIASGTGYLKVDTTAAITWSTTAVDVAGTLTAGNFGSSWVQLNASYAVYYKKFGDMIFLKGTCTAAGTGAFTVGTLPSSPDCRPPAKIFLSLRNANGIAVSATIDTDGTVACGSHDASVAITFDNISFCNS